MGMRMEDGPVTLVDVLIAMRDVPEGIRMEDGLMEVVEIPMGMGDCTYRNGERGCIHDNSNRHCRIKNKSYSLFSLQASKLYFKRTLLCSLLDDNN